jgi:hypothetical protein
MEHQFFFFILQNSKKRPNDLIYFGFYIIPHSQKLLERREHEFTSKIIKIDSAGEESSTRSINLIFVIRFISNGS